MSGNLLERTRGIFLTILWLVFIGVELGCIALLEPIIREGMDLRGVSVIPQGILVSPWTWVVGLCMAVLQILCAWTLVRVLSRREDVTDACGRWLSSESGFSKKGLVILISVGALAGYVIWFFWRLDRVLR